MIKTGTSLEPSGNSEATNSQVNQLGFNLNILKVYRNKLLHVNLVKYVFSL